MIALAFWAATIACAWVLGWNAGVRASIRKLRAIDGPPRPTRPGAPPRIPRRGLGRALHEVDAVERLRRMGIDVRDLRN